MAMCSAGEAKDKEQEGVLSAALQASCWSAPISLCCLPPVLGKGAPSGGKPSPGAWSPSMVRAPSLNPTGWLSEGWCPISPAELVRRVQGSGRKGESSWGRSLASRRVSWGREETGWRGGMDSVAWYLRGLDQSSRSCARERLVPEHQVQEPPSRARTRASAHVAEPVRGPARGSPMPPGNGVRKGAGAGALGRLSFPQRTPGAS